MSFGSLKSKYSVIHTQMCTSFILDICKQSHMLRISISFMIYISIMKGCLFVVFVCHLQIFWTRAPLVAFFVPLESPQWAWGAPGWVHNVSNSNEEAIVNDPWLRGFWTRLKALMFVSMLSYDMNIQYGWVVNWTCNHLQGHHKMICFMFNHEFKRLNLESEMEWSMWKGVK